MKIRDSVYNSKVMIHIWKIMKRQKIAIYYGKKQSKSENSGVDENQSLVEDMD
jgi:hypothetical protein